MRKTKHNVAKYRRWTTRVIVLSLALVLVLPLIPYAIHYSDATAATSVRSGGGASPDKSNVPNPGADLWRDVRQRELPVRGQTQVRGVDTDVLINKYGEDWRQFRMQMLAPYGAVLMGGVLVLILAYYFIKGPMKIPGGYSGKKVLRFVLSERLVHWFTVTIFWILGITGLILLYGRFVLIPLLGPEGFGVTASACKEAHNLLGPIFLFAIVIMFITFVKDNLPAKEDAAWLMKAGGMFGGHASAGRFNAGEKIWFWIACVLGLALAITGLILDFAIFGQGREVMAVSHVIHGISAIIVMAVSFGHIYLALGGMQGSINSMTSGYVDANWAKGHHDIWYEEIKSQTESTEEEGGVSSAGVAQPRRGD